MQRCLFALAQVALCGAFLGLTLLVGLCLYHPRTADAQAEEPGKTKQFTQITAQRLSVVDAAGQVRGEMAMLQGKYPGIQLFDTNKTPRLNVFLGPNGIPLIMLTDAEGHGRLNMGCGEEDAPALQLQDAKERERLQVGFDEAGDSILNINDSMGKPRINAAFTADNVPYVATFDAQHKLTATLKPVKGK